VREQLKSLLNKAESYLPADKITNIRSLLKQYSKVKKEITEKLRLWKNIEAARKSDSGKTNAAARVNKLTEDLQNVTDAIDAVKQQRDALKNNSDYIEIQQQIAATKQELKKLIFERGYKLVSTPDGIKRRVRTRMFEGITNTQRGANTGVITGFDKNGIRRRMWVKSPFLLAALQGSNSICFIQF
jgi:multidrug efflux pump subunit AcrA (membrane-fusion protein)